MAEPAMPGSPAGAPGLGSDPGTSGPSAAGASPVVQLAYASVSASGRSTGHGGWQVLGTTGSPGPAETAVLESGVVTQFHGHIALPEFASERDRDGALRRLAHLALADGSSALWHAVEAGTDATGRPGNVFTHAVLERADAARRSAVRAVELWRSPLFLRPFGGREVEAARLDDRASLLPAGVVTRERVLSFLLVEPAPVWRAGFAAVLLDAVLGALDGGPRVVLGVDDQDDAALWIGVVSFLSSAQGARTLSWSVYERASDLEGAWDRGIHLAVVPRADLVDRFGDPTVPSARAVVLDEREQPRLGQDETPHETHLGQRVRARDWSELALAVLSDPELATRTTGLLDAVSAVPGADEARIDWPLAVAAALALAEQPAHDALAPANRILAEATPRAALADPVAGALAHAAASALLAPGTDAAGAWARLAAEESAAAQGSFALDVLAGDYVVRALGDDEWLLGRSTPPVSERASAPASETDRGRALAALAALSLSPSRGPATTAASGAAASVAASSGDGEEDEAVAAELGPAAASDLADEAPDTAPVRGESDAERLTRALRTVRSIDLLARAGAFGDGRVRAGAGAGPAAARALAAVLASANGSASPTGADELVRAATAAVERTVLPVLPAHSGALAAAAGPLGAFARALVVQAIEAASAGRTSGASAAVSASGAPASGAAAPRPLGTTPAEAVVWLEGAGGSVPPAPYPGSAALVADATPFETDAAIARLRHGMLDPGVVAVASAALLDGHGSWDGIPAALRSRLDAAPWTIDDVLALERRAPGGIPDGIVARALATAPAAPPAAPSARTRSAAVATGDEAVGRGEQRTVPQRPSAERGEGSDAGVGRGRPAADEAADASAHGRGRRGGADPWGIRLETGETPVIAEAVHAPSDDPWNISAAETSAPAPGFDAPASAATALDEAAFGVVGSVPDPDPRRRSAASAELDAGGGTGAARALGAPRDAAASTARPLPPARLFPPYGRDDDARARELAELVVRGDRSEHAKRLAGLRLAAFDGSTAGRALPAGAGARGGIPTPSPASPFAAPSPAGSSVFGVPPAAAPGRGGSSAAASEGRAQEIDAAAEETASVVSDMFARLPDAAHDVYDGLLVSALLLLAGRAPFEPRSADRQASLVAAAVPEALADAEARQLAALGPRPVADAGPSASVADASIVVARALALAAAALVSDGRALELSPDVLGIAQRVAVAAHEAGLVDEPAWSVASAAAHDSLERALVDAGAQAARAADPYGDPRFAPQPRALPTHERLASALAAWHPGARASDSGGPGDLRGPLDGADAGAARGLGPGGEGPGRELGGFEELGLTFDEQPHDRAAPQRPASASNQRIGFWRNRKEH